MVTTFARIAAARLDRVFLKFLNDLELQREDEAKLSGKKFKPTIESPYRWRDWAAKPVCAMRKIGIHGHCS